MLSFVNRNSYLFVSAVAMGVAWAIGARLGGLWPSVAVAGVGVGLALVQRRLRGGASDVETWGEASAEVGHGKPLLLFLFSDTCGACLATRPIVDRIEQEAGPDLDVLRLNVADAAGQEAWDRFGARLVPTVIVLDGRGTEQYRSEGRLPRKDEVLAALHGAA